jgi:hypothetical protein
MKEAQPGADGLVCAMLSISELAVSIVTTVMAVP